MIDRSPPRLARWLLDRTQRVTGNFFQVLGVPPALGRGLTGEDDRPNAAPVVLVSVEPTQALRAE